MKRRTFLRTGLAVGAVGAVGAGGVGSVSTLLASPRVRMRADDPVRLSSNENPLGISPAAKRAIIDGLDRANRYPGASEDKLLPVLADKLGVPPAQLILGNGSTEILQMVVQYFGPKVQLVTADPTFEHVRRYAAPHALRLEQVPLRGDFAHDIDRMHAAVGNSSGPTLVYVCNPNNPTGTVTPCEQVDAWIARAPDNVHFLVDEAYFEYAEGTPGYWSALKWVPDRPNVIVVRTFSKIFGMAGLRLGYAVAHPEVARGLEAFAGASNTNHLALVAGLASLKDTEVVGRSLDLNRRGRAIAHQVLDDLGLEYLPSRANFLMHRIPGDLERYIGRMRQEGIIVGRPFPPMVSYNRLSFGLPEEMEMFAETLRVFRRRGWV